MTALRLAHRGCACKSFASRLVVCGILGASFAHAQPAVFTDVTPASMMQIALGEGAAWGDYDGDGWQDLVVAHEGGLLKLFHNDGGGTFTQVLTSAFDTPGNYTGAAWADFNNDGRLDLYAAEAFRRHRLFRNDGGGVFTDIATGALIDTSHTHGVAWADYDNDGLVDLFYATADYPADLLFRNLGGGVFANATPPVMLDAQYGRGCSWADYDRDGDEDLCVANFGTSRMFRNDGGGAFSDVTPAGLAVLGHGGGVSWGDFDNDGDFDVYVGEAYGEFSRLMRNDGGGVFTNVATPVLAPARNCIGGQWGDYDNDGDLDLFVGVQYGANFLARNDGGGVFTDVTSAVLADTGNALGHGWCDYDQDGDLDLFWANRGGHDRLVRNELPAGTQWLELDLVGTVSNRSAIGARVEVLAGTLRQVRRVDGGGGYNSQNTLRLHFGLGAAASADSIVIHWPSGIVGAMAGVGARQILTIVEQPQPVSAALTASPANVRLLAPAPNPFRERLVVRYELAAGLALRLRVHDAQGRAVRTLDASARRDPGRHEVDWDGCDDAGRPVRAGVYFVSLLAGRERRQRRIARLE